LAQKEKQYKALYCTGTNISKQQLQIFSDQYTPDMPIALSVRISSGIPLYFEPVPLNNDFEKVKPGKDSGFVNYFVDGGMMANFPISMFDTCMDNGNPLICHPLRFNNATLGIKLERPEQIDSLAHQSINIPPYQINKFSDYINALSNLMMETLNRKYPNLEHEKGRTIYISHNNLSPRPRRMDTDEKQRLYENGAKAVELFFATPEN
jgi:NTE family protein